eukprot:10600216-Alexandrium_andersonii.AAC.1
MAVPRTTLPLAALCNAASCKMRWSPTSWQFSKADANKLKRSFIIRRYCNVSLLPPNTRLNPCSMTSSGVKTCRKPGRASRTTSLAASI